MIRSVRKRESKEVEVNVTNMIDVIFVLLIFFILSTTFTKETGIDITKPTAESAGQLDKEYVLIGVTRDGTVHLNERQVDMAMLQAILKQEILRDPDKSVVIAADRGADMGTIVDIMDECNLASVKKVSVSAPTQ
ncbi:MAG TPA: biopolymer transporter ExbD [Fibrobacteraceae bacterium]|nr:biopolymer transporter ExbD [Fibrobacteraceae bacterium]